MLGPIFYNPRQSVPGLDSFSPSAGKPARCSASGITSRSDHA